MEIIKNVINWLERKTDRNDSTPPEGFCPNCRRRQEYGGKLYDAAVKEDMQSREPDAGKV